MKRFKMWLARLILAIQFRTENILGFYNSRIVNNPTGLGFISGKVSLQYPEHITIGKNSYVNGGKLCASPGAFIKIGENCLISYNVHMRTDMHRYKDKNILIKEQGYKEGDIIIGNDVWIGYGAQIFGGVTLGDGCVVGAGTIVKKDVMPYQMVVSRGGMRVIGERSQSLERKESAKQD